MSAAAVTELYRARLGAGSVSLLTRIAALWAQQFNPDDPMASISLIAQATASVVTGGQAVAAQEAAAYLQALTADAARAPVPAIDPYAVPSGLVGSTQGGMPMGDLTSIAAGVYARSRQAGNEAADAASSAYSWLNRVGSSEPRRAANAVTTSNAEADDRLTGRVNRITRPKACDWCRQIADRGYILAHAGFAAHAHCGCTASPEISSHVYSRRSRA